MALLSKGNASCSMLHATRLLTAPLRAVFVHKCAMRYAFGLHFEQRRMQHVCDERKRVLSLCLSAVNPGGRPLNVRTCEVTIVMWKVGIKSATRNANGCTVNLYVVQIASTIWWYVRKSVSPGSGR